MISASTIIVEACDFQAKQFLFEQQNGTTRFKGILVERREPESDDRCTSRVESQKRVRWVLLSHNSLCHTFFEFYNLPRKKSIR